jgi:hypothetical protein
MSLLLEAVSSTDSVLQPMITHLTAFPFARAIVLLAHAGIMCGPLNRLALALALDVRHLRLLASVRRRGLLVAHGSRK